ncbi:hypothetical protein PoB_004878600 [Plakobranchus ocellatus]|uniref:Uncharacterized protein n=1 Tax=Plakobranchus ocellatus TaxID=259542 RepID=A0AAV4BP94_9GAST|nr:hypothetical protein PoB_004878600 [Plakobranchus ocellatus]
MKTLFMVHVFTPTQTYALTSPIFSLTSFNSRSGSFSLSLSASGTEIYFIFCLRHASHSESSATWSAHFNRCSPGFRNPSTLDVDFVSVTVGLLVQLENDSAYEEEATYSFEELPV